MKILKKNQIIIYTFAFMLVTAGYLNYTSNITKDSIETSTQIEMEENKEVKESKNSEEVESLDEEKNDNEQIADVGDATLVSSSDVITVDDYFAKSRLERETMYSQMIETYEKILNSSNSNEAQKQTATQEITKINEKKNSIMICENLIKTKGFEECIVFVNEQSISVIIATKDTLKQEEIAQIQNIISREMNAKIENIHISTK